MLNFESFRENVSGERNPCLGDVLAETRVFADL
jgi:hypothetical protein